MARVRKAGQTRMLVAWAVGMLGGGTLLTVVGAALKAHYHFGAAACDTFGGPTGQCAVQNTGYSVGQILQPVGIGMIVVGAIGSVLMLVVAAGTRQPEGSGTASALNSTSAPGEAARTDAAYGSMPAPRPASSPTASTDRQASRPQRQNAGWQPIGPIEEGRQ